MTYAIKKNEGKNRNYEMPWWKNAGKGQNLTTHLSYNILSACQEQLGPARDKKEDEIKKKAKKKSRVQLDSARLSLA